jgi:hypothetical protein
MASIAVQTYSVREELSKDAGATVEQLQKSGYTPRPSSSPPIEHG